MPLLITVIKDLFRDVNDDAMQERNQQTTHCAKITLTFILDDQVQHRNPSEYDVGVMLIESEGTRGRRADETCPNCHKREIINNLMEFPYSLWVVGQ